MASPPVPLSVPERGDDGEGEGEARWVEEVCRAFVLLLLSNNLGRLSVR